MIKLFEIGSEVKDVAKGYEQVEAEKQLEQKMIEDGIKRFHKNIQKSQARKNEATGKD